MGIDLDLWKEDGSIDWGSCYETGWEDDGDQDEERYERMIEEHEKQEDKETEEKAFRGVIGQGVNAPAFREDLDTLEMIKLKKEGLSLREIGEKLGCSPSTVRNRINRFNLHR